MDSSAGGLSTSPHQIPNHVVATRFLTRLPMFISPFPDDLACGVDGLSVVGQTRTCLPSPGPLGPQGSPATSGVSLPLDAGGLPTLESRVDHHSSATHHRIASSAAAYQRSSDATGLRYTPLGPSQTQPAHLQAVRRSLTSRGFSDLVV